MNCRIPTASSRLPAATRRYGAAVRRGSAHEECYRVFSSIYNFREIPGSCANRWETWHLVPNRSEGTRATIPDESFASPDSRRFLGIVAVTNDPRQRHPVATHSAPQRLNAAKGGTGCLGGPSYHTTRARAYHKTTRFGAALFVFGGQCSGGSQGSASGLMNNMPVFDLVRMSWETRDVRGAQPRPRYWHTAELLEGKLFVILGGFDGSKVRAPNRPAAAPPASRRRRRRRPASQPAAHPCCLHSLALLDHRCQSMLLRQG